MRYGRMMIGIVLAGVVSPGLAPAAQDDARAFVKQTLDAAPRTSFTANGKLSTQAGVRELELNFKWMGDHAASYLEVIGPQDVKGMRFLFQERTEGPDTQYIYVPIMKRTVQISEETRNQPFLGSDFFVADLVAGDMEAYTYTFVGEETIDGRATKLVEIVPKDAAGDVYSKRIAAIDSKDLVIVRNQFFDKNGKLLKVWKIEKLEKIDGVWTPRLQSMVNVQSDTKSTIELINIKYNVELPEHMFTRTYIDR